MDVMQLKTDLHNLIDKVNDTSILSAIKTILIKQTEDIDFWNELPLNVQDSVKRGIEQADRGETKSHREVMQKHKKWL